MTERKLEKLAREHDVGMEAVRATVFRSSVDAALKSGSMLPELMDDCIRLWKEGVWPDGKKCYRDTSRLVALRALIGTIPEKMLAKMVDVEGGDRDGRRPGLCRLLFGGAALRVPSGGFLGELLWGFWTSLP